MATITFGSDTAYSPVTVAQRSYASSIEGTGEKITLTSPFGSYALHGSFQYSSAGYITGGSITKLTYTEGSKTAWTAENISIPVHKWLAKDAEGRSYWLDSNGDFDGNDVFNLSNASDRSVYAYSGDDTVYGAGGHDEMYGNLGNDVLDGGTGADTLFGGQGADTLYGQADGDVLYANMADDLILGDAGNDTLFGGQGDDTLQGGDGDDFLAGNLGNDLYVGGDGNDLIQLSGLTGRDRVQQFETGDRLVVSQTDLANWTWGIDPATGNVALVKDQNSLVFLGVSDATAIKARGDLFLVV